MSIVNLLIIISSPHSSFLPQRSSLEHSCISIWKFSSLLVRFCVSKHSIIFHLVLFSSVQFINFPRLRLSNMSRSHKVTWFIHVQFSSSIWIHRQYFGYDQGSTIPFTQFPGLSCVVRRPFHNYHFTHNILYYTLLYPCVSYVCLVLAFDSSIWFLTILRNCSDNCQSSGVLDSCRELPKWNLGLYPWSDSNGVLKVILLSLLLIEFCTRSKDSSQSSPLVPEIVRDVIRTLMRSLYSSVCPRMSWRSRCVLYPLFAAVGRLENLSRKTCTSIWNQ